MIIQNNTNVKPSFRKKIFANKGKDVKSFIFYLLIFTLIFQLFVFFLLTPDGQPLGAAEKLSLPSTSAPKDFPWHNVTGEYYVTSVMWKPRKIDRILVNTPLMTIMGDSRSIPSNPSFAETNLDTEEHNADVDRWLASTSAFSSAYLLMSGNLYNKNTPYVDIVTNSRDDENATFKYGDIILGYDKSKPSKYVQSYLVRRDNKNIKVQSLFPPLVQHLPVAESIPRVTVDHKTSGTSSGLMSALYYTDGLTVGSLSGDKKIAGTGVIDSIGRISPVGGVESKIAAAKEVEAEVFFVPNKNYDDGKLVGDYLGIRVIGVKKLEDAVRWLCENYTSQDDACSKIKKPFEPSLKKTSPVTLPIGKELP